MIMFAPGGFVAMTDRPRTRLDDAVPTGPELWPILLIHRVADSWIRFSVPQDGILKPLTHLRVDSLQRLFPEWRERLMEDSYYSINAFYRKGTAKQKYLSCLNACYCDLDYYKAGLPRSEAYRLMIQAQDDGIIPHASMMVDSGRGFWLIFVLVDEEGGPGPVLYHPRDPEPLRRYRLVQEALNTRIADFEERLEPDPRARDASRVTRVPGSTNTKSGTVVTYWAAQVNPETNLGLSYTLPNLMRALGVPDTPSVPERARLKVLDVPVVTPHTEVRPLQMTLDGRPTDLPERKGTHPGRRRGLKAMFASRLVALERLMQIRGAFPDGMRNNAALIYAVTLRGAGNTEGAVRRHLMQMGRACELSETEMQWALISSATMYQYSDKTIISELEITPDELAQIEHIRPDRIPRKAGRPKGTRPGDLRQGEALRILQERGWMTSRELAASLTRAGYPTTHATARKDRLAVLLDHPELAPPEGAAKHRRLPLGDPE